MNEKDLLIEIGCEEIPAGFILPAVQFLENKFRELFDDKKIKYEKIEKFATPRRLAILVKNLSAFTETEEKEYQGPPAHIAYDENGELTIAGRKFIEAKKAKIEQAFLKDTPKGKYLFVKKIEGGEKTEDILKKEIPQIIEKIPFPKTMKWGEQIKFARPIRWIVGLFGEKILDIEVAGIKASNRTFSNRNLEKEIEIKHPAEYETLLEKNYVIAGFEKRKNMLYELLKKSACSVGGVLVENEELLNEVTNLVEYPVVVICEFNERFTFLPKDVLVTALAKHQRAFSIEDSEGNLKRKFIVILNNPFAVKEKVKPWFERMVISRLEDAEFYIKEDLKKGLLPLVEEEKKVTWIEGLGTLYDKTQRLLKLGEIFIQYIKDASLPVYKKVAFLSKADLLSNLVREKEFTSLQGTAGKEYLLKLGEDKKVAIAVEDQYLPRYQGDILPRTAEGALLSILDKADNIYASFLKGEIPKGSRDPFGLRRQLTGIFLIILDRKIHISLFEIFENVKQLFGKDGETIQRIKDFIKEREKTFFIDRGFKYDMVDAVLSIVEDDVYDAFLRLQALKSIEKEEDFEKLVIGQKRISNILKNIEIKGKIQEELFEKEEEKRLFEKANEIEPFLKESIKHRKYKNSIEFLISLRPYIDKFFDHVFVMTENEEIRNNRLSLLKYLRNLFLTFADFSKIAM